MDKSTSENVNSESREVDQEGILNKEEFDYRIPFKKDTITEQKVYNINNKDSNKNKEIVQEADNKLSISSLGMKKNMPTSKLKFQPQTNSINTRPNFKKSIFDIIT